VSFQWASSVPLTFSVKIPFFHEFSLIRFLNALCVEPFLCFLFVCLCRRLQRNNFLLAVTPLLLQACVSRPLLHPPSPAHYRSDYCYFCAYSLLSHLPLKDLIISGMTRFKLLLFSSYHYCNVTSLPKQFSSVSPFSICLPEEEALFQ